jgi:hypothetical protein
VISLQPIEADKCDLAQVELLDERCKIVGERVEVVALPGWLERPQPRLS